MKKKENYGSLKSIDENGVEVRYPILGMVRSNMKSNLTHIDERLIRIAASEIDQEGPVLAVFLETKHSSGKEVLHDFTLSHEAAFQLMMTLIGAIDRLGLKEDDIDDKSYIIESTKEFPKIDENVKNQKTQIPSTGDKQKPLRKKRG
jgi:hypothetical protein